MCHFASLHFNQPLLCQVQRGTIKCRRDPLDSEEWQFSLVKSIAYHNTQQSHEFQAETSGKMDALQWIKARTAGAMLGPGEDAETAEAALNDVMPDKKKGRQRLWPYKTKMKMKRRMEMDRGKSWKKLLMRQKSCLTWAGTAARSMLPKGYRRC